MTELIHWTKLIFLSNLVPTINLISLKYTFARLNINSCKTFYHSQSVIINHCILESISELLFMIVRLAIRYLYRYLPNQPGSYLNWKLLAKDHQTPELLRSPLRVVWHRSLQNMVKKRFWIMSKDCFKIVLQWGSKETGVKSVLLAWRA